MATAQKQKDAAPAATDPRHGPIHNPPKDQNMNTERDSTAAAVTASETRDVGDAIDIINRAISINELIFESAHRLGDREVISAFVEGTMVIREFLDDAKSVLYANIGQEGDAA